MKKILIAVAALTAATPALANDQLARSLGVEPGQYTAAELAIIKSRSTETGNDAVVFIDNTRFAPSNAIHNSVAASHFDRAVEEDRGNER